MARLRRFDLDELATRPGTYFNPVTEILIVVDDSAHPGAGLADRVAALLEEIQASLLEEATAFRDARTTEVGTVEEALEAAKSGFAILPWSAVGDDGEDRLAAEGITVRCLQRPDGTVPDDYDEGDLRAIVARAY